jgi:hypothetical protein
MSNRLASQRRIWLLVKGKEKELKDERNRFERDTRVQHGKLLEGEDSIPSSKCRSIS